jgi:hypothetical protein
MKFISSFFARLSKSIKSLFRPEGQKKALTALGQAEATREVLTAHGGLQADMATVKDHLRTLNGRVFRHEQELAERRHSCPLVDDIERSGSA